MITVPIEIGDLAGGHFRELSARVDTGTAYTLIPRSVLRQLGITPIETLKLESVGGDTVECDFGPARMRLEGSEWVVPVVFGQEDADPLIAFTALQIFRLGVEPVGQRLIPVTARLY